ncbi:hypothetical protein VTN31DRAFT_432 [Thermomyces dupontii]|uniref:uncharacterized protein n=1 Tax=Talaromyces thermophilus TaxID=28565 RepID=UPI00374443DC
MTHRLGTYIRPVVDWQTYATRPLSQYANTKAGNSSTYEDFEDLIKAGISVEGKIVIVKYGGIFRGLKVKRAQELGAVGVIIYSDPQEDGEITEENGYKAYPDGPARNPSAVQRGSVQFLSIAPGDPTTPGYPSKPGVPRQDTSHAIPSIPSLPISYGKTTDHVAWILPRRKGDLLVSQGTGQEGRLWPRTERLSLRFAHRREQR